MKIDCGYYLLGGGGGLNTVVKRCQLEIYFINYVYERIKSMTGLRSAILAGADTY